LRSLTGGEETEKGTDDHDSPFRLHGDAGDQKFRTVEAEDEDSERGQRCTASRRESSCRAGRRFGRLQNENRFVIDRSVCSRL